MDYQEIHNNGEICVKDAVSPGVGWKIGSGRTCYNNGVVNSMFKKNPGQGWKIGRMKGVK